MRNRDKLLDPSSKTSETHLLPIIEYIKPGMNILEIGCSFGSSLAMLNSKVASLRLHGLDPSREAISEGSRIYPDQDLRVGTAEDIALFNIKFDFIFFGFCLYLIDRESLDKIVKLVNDNLSPGGFVGIIDFDSKLPLENPYTHCEGIISYKMDYSQLFLSMPNYFLVSKISWSHLGPNFHENRNERCSTQVLYKELT